LGPLVSVSPALADHDVILVDMRGTGVSRPRLGCADERPLFLRLQASVLPPAREALEWIRVTRRCVGYLRRRGIDLGAYNTNETAQDLRAVRRALAIPRWNVLAASYGTIVAQELVRVDSAGIRALALDSVVAPDSADLKSVTERSGEVERLVRACARDGACTAISPDPVGALRAVIARYNRSPAAVTVGGREFRVTGDDLWTWVYADVRDTARQAQVPAAIERLAAGDRQVVETLARIYVSDPRKLPFNATEDAGLSRTTICHDFGRFADRPAALRYMTRFPERARQLYRSFLTPLFCADWPTGRAPRSFNQLISTRIPTLTLGGGFDPSTPPAWARRVRAGMPNSFDVRFTGYGHGVTLTICGQVVINSFFNDPSRRPDDACIPPSSPYPWSPTPGM